MGSETIVTVGMVSTFAAVIGCSWGVFRYIGKIENMIEKNSLDINNLGQVSREKDLRLLRELKRQMNNIKAMTNFLNKKLDYNNSEIIQVDDTDF